MFAAVAAVVTRYMQKEQGKKIFVDNALVWNLFPLVDPIIH